MHVLAGAQRANFQSLLGVFGLHTTAPCHTAQPAHTIKNQPRRVSGLETRGLPTWRNSCALDQSKAQKMNTCFSEATDHLPRSVKPFNSACCGEQLKTTIAGTRETRLQSSAGICKLAASFCESVFLGIRCLHWAAFSLSSTSTTSVENAQFLKHDVTCRKAQGEYMPGTIRH